MLPTPDGDTSPDGLEGDGWVVDLPPDPPLPEIRDTLPCARPPLPKYRKAMGSERDTVPCAPEFPDEENESRCA